MLLASAWQMIFGHETLFRKARFRNGIKGNGVSVWQQLCAVGPDLSWYRFVARMRNKHDFRTKVAMCEFRAQHGPFTAPLLPGVNIKIESLVGRRAYRSHSLFELPGSIELDGTNVA